MKLQSKKKIDETFGFTHRRKKENKETKNETRPTKNLID